ncbi:hypothetical protein KP509_23G062300 [Ceratopteris richardii]|uniref:Uncharacterized protein n=1 Tax=Ceratopteris richardii TaxID=49495 RepID=A0A8T2S0I4_CERRI|nr:hypothetical protein KP509_23G062300 [Ceratopteris richardii]
MADQSRVQPVWLVLFNITFVVLELKGINLDYNLLLVRPWLRNAKVRQNWDEKTITFRRGNAKFSIPLDEEHHCLLEQKPVLAEPPHMLDGLEEDEEQQFLEANRDLLSFGVVDVNSIISSEWDNMDAVVCMESLELQA